jgi:DNA invertase Pin-like site-specific DNA recombinase
MHLRTHQQQQLLRISEARKRCERAERDSRRIALEAVASGVPQSRIADALGISRMTMWRWLRTDGHPTAATR